MHLVCQCKPFLSYSWALTVHCGSSHGLAPDSRPCICVRQQVALPCCASSQGHAINTCCHSLPISSNRSGPLLTTVSYSVPTVTKV